MPVIDEIDRELERLRKCRDRDLANGVPWEFHQECVRDDVTDYHDFMVMHALVDLNERVTAVEALELGALRDALETLEAAVAANGQAVAELTSLVAQLIAGRRSRRLTSARVHKNGPRLRSRAVACRQPRRALLVDPSGVCDCAVEAKCPVGRPDHHHDWTVR